ncbi:MAG: DUF4251 domain-containing protein [Bacteroidales bacterium]|jgi:hypothetical protein
MKKIFIIITTLMVISSCTTTKEAKSSRVELRKEKKLAEQAIVKQAVESKRFIIKFDRLYLLYGGIVDLVPRANYIIIDGEKAIINTAYLGRQYDIRPIAGINLFGKAMNYELTNKLSKGSYEIKMKVKNEGSNSFDVNLTISINGNCSASINSLKINNINYSGYVVPISDNTNNPVQNGNII